MHTRRLATKTRPRSFQPPLYPPAPADTREGTVLARVAVLWVHARTQSKTKNNKKRLSPARNRRRRYSSGSSGRPRMYQPSSLRKMTKLITRYLVPGRSLLTYFLLRPSINRFDYSIPILLEKTFMDGPTRRSSRKILSGGATGLHTSTGSFSGVYTYVLQVLSSQYLWVQYSWKTLEYSKYSGCSYCGYCLYSDLRTAHTPSLAVFGPSALTARIPSTRSS